MLRLLPRLHFLIAALLLAATPARADTLQVLDITDATPKQLGILKSGHADRWTLEMGDRLVVVGGDASADGEPRTIARHEGIDPSRLLLRARGCSEHASERGRMLAEGGRWELREVASHEVARLLAESTHGWREVPRNGVLATRWRAGEKGVNAPDPLVQAVVDRLDTGRWFDDVETLASWNRSSYGTDSLTAARDFIATRFDELGLDVELMPFTMNGVGGGTITRYNAIGTWTGSTQPERLVIVGGHYDSRNNVSTATANTPGAEDNATGCAGVIELARMLLPSEPSRSIAFMCYAGEEQGLHGSLAHVARLNQEGALPDIDLVATLDMIGYSADADLEALFESSASQAPLLTRFAEAAATYAPELAVLTSTMPFGSDHVPYLNAGLPGMLSIENDWDVYPHYHRTTDTPANLGPNALAMGGAILKTNAAVIADLAGLPFTGFRDGFE